MNQLVTQRLILAEDSSQASTSPLVLLSFCSPGEKRVTAHQSNNCQQRKEAPVEPLQDSGPELVAGWLFPGFE